MAKLQKNNTEKYLRHFAESVIKRGRQILKAKKKNVTGKLLNSLKYRLESTSKGYNLVFKGAKHAMFVDKGVSGTKTTRTYHNIFGKRERSPFKYTNKQPPASVLDKWIVRKGIAPRTETGQFMGRKSLQFLIARSIKSKGLAATSFFSKPMSIELAKFDTGILKAFKTDIITHFETLELK
jgi:hypothetical protein